MSTHQVNIVEIEEIIQHDNAENLELVKVFGWQCCIKKGQFKPKDRAIYIEPDYNVPTSRPEFSFLKKEGQNFERIKVRKFRGKVSAGLLISVPPDLSDKPVGYNAINDLGIERYEPPMPKFTYGNFVKAPSGLYSPKFDIENYQRYKHVFNSNEEVIVTEKIHGSNSRMVWARNADTGEFEQFCGSRTNWMQKDEKNIWWMALKQNPSIAEWCKANPEIVLYGEVFGQVQNLKYGAGNNDIFFAAFAAIKKNIWMNYDDMVLSLKPHGVSVAPMLYRGPLDEEKINELAERDSSWPKANHMSEGVVILPVVEREHPEIGRVCLKRVSNRYLEKS